MAVVGAGRLGGFHAEKLARNDDVELIAVVDPVAENRCRVAAACDTRAEAVVGPLISRLDAAIIAAPTRLHHRLALDLLGHGIHLLVEKPLCSTLAEAEELVRLARRRKLVLQVGHVERFNPAFAAAATAVAGPKYIEAVRAGEFTFRSTDIGVVLDLMIHDIDLVLSLVRSPLKKIDALGISVLGGHEDVANARLEFECGCVATLSASRVSYEPVRRMQIWSPRAFAAVDFAARRTTLVRPSADLLGRRIDVDGLNPDELQQCRTDLSERHMPREELEFAAVDALSLESEDFVGAIRTPRRPRVTGSAGRDAMAVAEQILAQIQVHAWDETADGPVGPLAAPRRSVVPAPHFDVAPAAAPIVRREAG